MATRCIIAEPYGDGWRGRYSHWDGYPSAKLPELFALVKRDGIERVRQVLLHDFYSWSSIDPDTVDNSENKASGWSVVVGYGFAHNDLETPSDFFTHANTDFAWAEFLYILGDASVLVFSADANGSWVPVGEYRYDSELSLT